MRLNKYLSKCGIASRRAADRLIEQGRVAINGDPIKELGVLIDENRDEVAVDGKLCTLPPEPVYIILNKPKGYVTTMKDEYGRKTVLDLIRNVGQRVYPVGRLDLDTEGILLLTDDGELSYRLTHPKFEVKKLYRVTVRGEFPVELVSRIDEGVRLEDGFVASAKAKVVGSQGRFSTLILELSEGRKREVRRIMRMLGFPVHNLRRIKFADLSCEGMKVGTWRYLNRKEVEKLKKKVELS